MSYTYLSTDGIKQLALKYGGSETNTGSTEAQVALITRRIQHLSGHLKTHAKDHATRRALLCMVGQRRRLLDYLKQRDINKYRTIILDLGIRK